MSSTTWPNYTPRRDLEVERRLRVCLTGLSGLDRPHDGVHFRPRRFHRCIEPVRISVGDVTLNVLDFGAGPEVLILHDFPDRAIMWSAQTEALLKEGYHGLIFEASAIATPWVWRITRQNAWLITA